MTTTNTVDSFKWADRRPLVVTPSTSVFVCQAVGRLEGVNFYGHNVTGCDLGPGLQREP